MLERVKQTIREHRLLAPGDGVVVAVSGGVDSMVLFHLLANLGPSLRLRLHAAHLNHGLRGAEAERDASAVQAWAEALGVPLTVERAGPLDRRGGSLQRAARAARHHFLERVADRARAERIALGHNQDDLAETVLLNLLRGAGLRGLAGIPPARGRIIRPLLDVPREAILAYARAHGVPWVEDSSNREITYRRNRVRAEILPRLAKDYNPQIRAVLARTAAILRAEDAFLETLAGDALRSLSRPATPGRAVLDASGLGGLHPVLRGRALRAALRGLPGAPVLSAGHLTALEAWAAAGPRPGRCDFLRRVTAWWEGDRLVLAPKGVAPPLQPVPLPLGVATRVTSFGMTFLAERVGAAAGAPTSPEPDEAWLDAVAAAAGLAVRAWRAGDRFRPLGLGGTKKLQDFFVDAKLPREMRGRVPLVVSGDHILWVVGHRIDEGAKVTDATRERIRITARGDPTADPGVRI